jgi:hypothetical protein
MPVRITKRDLRENDELRADIVKWVREHNFFPADRRIEPRMDSKGWYIEVWHKGTAKLYRLPAEALL